MRPVFPLIRYLFLLLIGLSANAAAQSCYFHSGFEPGTVLHQYELNGHADTRYADLYGLDQTTGYDWEADLDAQGCVGNFRIYYEVGDTTRVKASLAPDPLDPANTALKFQLFAANVLDVPHPKGRIQAALHHNDSLDAFAFRVRMWLHPDIALLDTYPGTITWFTLMEFWNNLPTQPWPFRVTLNLRKPQSAPGSGLYFGLHGQIKTAQGWQDVWSQTNTDLAPSFGQWVTLEVHFREGDATHGRFRMWLTTPDGTTHTLFDITHFTHHPDDPAPDGVRSFNPMKLYTSATLIDSMAAQGAELSVYWDEFEFWRDTLATSAGEVRSAPDPVLAFPNPCRDRLCLVDGRHVQRARLLDLQGRTCIEVEGPVECLATARLAPGIYWLEVRYLDGQRRTQRILRQ